MADRKKPKHGVAAATINPSLKELLRKLHTNGIETVTDGYKTCNQLAKDWGITYPTARYHCRRLVDAGIFEEKSFRIMAGTGVAPVKHYRINEC